MNDSASASAGVAPVAPRSGPLDRLLRAQLLKRLCGLQHGRVLLKDNYGTVSLGDAPSRGLALDVRVEVLSPAFYGRIAASGSVGAGEAYIEGYWRCDNLVDLVRLLLRNRAHMDGLERGTARLGAWLLRAWQALRRNSVTGAAKNIAAHYDLGNDFFSLFLSADLMYSSAIWQGHEDTLERASARKLESICRKLDLKPDDHVCEIGSGWGGFAFHAAENYGCCVTTVTISQQQYEWVSREIRERGLGKRIQVLLKDYRELEGEYDKVVSIEMIEAVGAAYLKIYFSTVARLLKVGGRALIQAITIEDHRYAQARGSVDFIKRHIFPGSFIPSIQAILNAKMQACDLALIHLEDFGASYARTLQSWRERFLARLPEVRGQCFDERFIRMWEYYLAYCEGGFRERSIGVAHLVFEKPGVAVDSTGAG